MYTLCNPEVIARIVKDCKNSCYKDKIYEFKDVKLENYFEFIDELDQALLDNKVVALTKDITPTLENSMLISINAMFDASICFKEM